MGVVPSCPVEFDTAPSGMGCIPKCPKDKGFEVVGATCAYKGRPSLAAQLKVAPIVWQQQQPGKPPPSPVSFESLGNAAVFRQIAKDFSDEIAVIQGKIDRDEKLATAFQKMQDAENAEDVSPEAYQRARINYYTMVKGDGWIETEKARIRNIETKPAIDRYKAQYQVLMNQKHQQDTALDFLEEAKTKFLGVEKELEFSVGAMDKQIKLLKDKIMLNNNKRITLSNQTIKYF